MVINTTFVLNFNDLELGTDWDILWKIGVTGIKGTLILLLEFWWIEDNFYTDSFFFFIVLFGLKNNGIEILSWLLFFRPLII